MKKLLIMLVACAFVLIPATLFAMPTVYPTGTTIYKPEKTWSGYTLLCSRYLYEFEGEMVVNPLIDMNGNEVHNWTSANRGKLLPGGKLLSMELGSDNLIQVDWDGNVENRWGAGLGLHHDQQKEGNPVGYYVPGMDFVDQGNVLILGGGGGCGGPGQSDQAIYELDWAGNVVWEWWWRDHYVAAGNDLGSPDIPCGSNRLFNVASWLGPNRHYDATGDERFNPDNVIVDTAFGDRIFIIEKATGNIVWSVGPDFSAIPQLKDLGYPVEAGPFNLIGMGAFVGGMLHHAHMIPEGLPGAGNILVFNNGKPYSLVTEFDPVTLQIVWEYSGRALGYGPSHSWAHTFFSASESSAQRLPNGNTLICEADTGRVFEVTVELETVWEYINPRMWKGPPTARTNASTYRAFRVPYDWIPQLQTPVEKAVIPPDNTTFRIEEPEPIPAPTGWGIPRGGAVSGGAAGGSGGF